MQPRREVWWLGYGTAVPRYFEHRRRFAGLGFVAAALNSPIPNHKPRSMRECDRVRVEVNEMTGVLVPSESMVPRLNYLLHLTETGLRNLSVIRSSDGPIQRVLFKGSRSKSVASEQRKFFESATKGRKRQVNTSQANVFHRIDVLGFGELLIVADGPKFPRDCRRPQ